MSDKIRFSSERFPNLCVPVETAGDIAWRKMKAAQKNTERLEAEAAIRKLDDRQIAAARAREMEGKDVMDTFHAKFREEHGRHPSIWDEEDHLIAMGLSMKEVWDVIGVPF